MIPQPLPNSKTQFSQKKEVGSYDNISLDQRNDTHQINKEWSNDATNSCRHAGESKAQTPVWKRTVSLSLKYYTDIKGKLYNIFLLLYPF